MFDIELFSLFKCFLVASNPHMLETVKNICLNTLSVFEDLTTKYKLTDPGFAAWISPTGM